MRKDDLYITIIILAIAFFMLMVAYSIKEDDFEYKHDSPEDVVRSSDMKLYNNSFSLTLDRELKYVKPADTNSMIPTIDYGHTLVEISCPCDVKVGDIVSFKYKNRTKNILHRIVSIDSKKGIHTRGDNAKTGEWIKKEDIVGKVIAIIY